MSKKKFNLVEAGAMGRDIYNSLVDGITILKPVKGRLFIEVELDIEDKGFGDDYDSKAKLIIEVDLEE